MSYYLCAIYAFSFLKKTEGEENAMGKRLSLGEDIDV